MTEPDLRRRPHPAAQRRSRRRTRRREFARTRTRRCAPTRRLRREYRRLASTREARPPSRTARGRAAALADRIAALLGRAPRRAVRGAPSGAARRVLALAASVAGRRLRRRRRRHDAEDAERVRPTSPPASSPISPAPRSPASRSTSPPPTGTRSSPGSPPARPSAPQIVDLAQQGFTLEGGRVAIVDRIPAPTLVYRRREHLDRGHRTAARRRGRARRRGDRDDRRLSCRALVRRGLELCRRHRHRRKRPRRLRRGVPPGAEARGRSARAVRCGRLSKAPGSR